MSFEVIDSLFTIKADGIYDSCHGCCDIAYRFLYQEQG